MNTGLGSLTLLKSRLLPAQAVAQTDQDGAITLLGLGVARWFEQLCDRRFDRVEGDIYLTRSDRTYVVVPRYPLETVTGLDWLLIDSNAGAWMPSGLPYLLFPHSGLIDFAEAIGTRDMQLRVTYTGGYWWDQTEDNSGVLPTGAFPLPNDLQYAWLEQAAFLFERRNKLGLEKITHNGTFAVAPADLLPHVSRILASYRRNSLT